MDIKKEINVLLAREGMTKSELAARLNESPSNFSKKFCYGDFRLSYLEKIAAALGYDLKVTFTKKETK